MARPGSTCPPPTLTRLGEEGTDRVVVGFRPEDVDLVSEHDEGAFPVDVALVEELGSDAFLYGTPAGGDAGTQIIGRVDPRNPPSKGARVHLRIRPGQEHYFSPATGTRLSA